MPKAKDHRGTRVLNYLLATSICSGLLLLIVEIFRNKLYFVLSTESYLVFHIIAELFSITVSFSMFGLGWFTYKRSKNDYTLFLGIAFLGIGLLDFIHTLSFPGMPGFFSPSSTDKGIQFWLAARMFAAIAFLASAFIFPKFGKSGLPKKTLLAAVLAIVAVDFVWVILYPQTLLTFFEPGIGLTGAKIFVECLIMAISSLALVRYYIRFRKTNEQFTLWFMCALAVSIFSELAFTLYHSAYDTFNMIGHIQKIIVFVLIYRGVFVSLIDDSYIKLQQSEEKFSTAFINSPNLMAITKPETGEIVEINGAFCEFFRYKREEVIGKTSAELNIWAYPKQREHSLALLNKTGRARELEVALRTKDGEIRYAIDSIDYIYLDGEKYLLSVAVDITDSKKAEKSLQKSEQHNKDLSELRAKLIQTISHQLRTPLSSIRWNLESILDGSMGSLTSSQRQFLRVTSDANAKIIDRLNDLLTIVDIEEKRITFEKGKTAVDSLVKSVIVQERTTLKEKDIRFEYHLPNEPLPLVLIDTAKLRSAMEKLLENAIRYTPKKGKISIDLKKIGSKIRFEVTDTGIGVPEAEQRYLFNSFFRASNAFAVEPDASGAGLAIAKYFVEQQGGHIGFTSKEGKGSTFWFELPAKGKSSIHLS